MGYTEKCWVNALYIYVRYCHRQREHKVKKERQDAAFKEFLIVREGETQ